MNILQDNKVFWTSWGKWYILSIQWRTPSSWNCIKTPNTGTSLYIGTKKPPNRFPGFCKIDLEFLLERDEVFEEPRQFFVFLILRIKMKKESKCGKSAMNLKIFMFFIQNFDFFEIPILTHVDLFKKSNFANFFNTFKEY